MTNVKNYLKTLKSKYDTLDPNELCDIMDIEIITVDLPKHIKGFFVKIMEQDFIYINNRLNQIEQKIALCHELGHAVMHSELNFIYMSSSTLMATSKYELEADFFASCILLDESIFLGDYDEAMTLEQISINTGIPLYYVQLRWEYNLSIM